MRVCEGDEKRNISSTHRFYAALSYPRVSLRARFVCDRLADARAYMKDKVSVRFEYIRVKLLMGIAGIRRMAG